MSKEWWALYNTIKHIDGHYKKELTVKEEETIKLVYQMFIDSVVAIRKLKREKLST